MSASVFIQIVARNIFSRSFENFEELPRFLLIWVTFLGAAVVFREAGHLGVEFFVNLLPKKIKYYAMILSNIFNTLFILLLIFVGGEIAMLTMVQRSIQMRVPVGLVYMVIPISGVIMLLVLVERLIDLYQTKQTIDT
jgi:TRAP-type C4-dicarboxylate transport system permease small subunit